MPNPTRDPVERFLSKCSEPDSNGCMLWRGGRDQDGYGMFWFDGRNVRAHRWAYETFVGPIPNGHQIDHVAARGCASTSCVNPAHLEAVTGKENLLRGRTFQAANAAKTHCHRGHPFDAANTYVHPTDGSRNCRECKRIWRRTHASAA